MYTNDRRYISDVDTRDDYIELNLTVNSPADVWERAIRMLRNRIVGRFFDPMDALLQADVNKNGFAAMALGCLLVETLMQFREGYPQSKEYSMNKCYRTFLEQQMGPCFDEHTARRFFYDIRCGILHSGQTKNGSCLTFDTDYTAMMLGNNVLMVDVPNMYREMTRYFERYCNELMDVRNEELRSGFVCKMDDISRKLEGSNLMDNLWFAIHAKQGRFVQGSFTELVIRNVLNDRIELLSGRRNARQVNIMKEDIEDALYYWPNRSAIQMLDNGKPIYNLLYLCRDVADQVINLRTA